MKGEPEGKLHEAEATHAIIGAAMEVHNAIGFGLHEKPYENALAVEFGLRGIPFTQQENFPVLYKSVEVGRYIPDLIAFGKVVVDTKVIEKITDLEKGRMLNYLRITGIKVGLILNFKHPRLEWARVVL